MTQERFAHYRTGIEEIDRAHWDLFEQMNRCEKVVALKNTEHTLDELHTLRVMLRNHCLYEMQYMISIGYPWASGHSHEHDKLLSKMDRIIDRSIDGVVYSQLTTDLETIFVDHIDHSDMQYVAFRGSKK